MCKTNLRLIMENGYGYKRSITSMFYYVAVTAGNLIAIADSRYSINYIYSSHLRCSTIPFKEHHSFY